MYIYIYIYINVPLNKPSCWLTVVLTVQRALEDGWMDLQSEIRTVLLNCQHNGINVFSLVQVAYETSAEI